MWLVSLSMPFQHVVWFLNMYSQGGTFYFTVFLTKPGITKFCCYLHRQRWIILSAYFFTKGEPLQEYALKGFSPFYFLLDFSPLYALCYQESENALRCSFFFSNLCVCFGSGLLRLYSFFPSYTFKRTSSLLSLVCLGEWTFSGFVGFPRKRYFVLASSKWKW